MSVFQIWSVALQCISSWLKKNLCYSQDSCTLNVNRHYFAHSVTSENNPQWLIEVICCDPFFSHLLCPLVLCPRTHNLMAPFYPKVFIPWPLTCLSLHLIIHSCPPTLCSPSLPAQAPAPCWASGCQKHEVLWQRPPAGMLSQGCYRRCWFRHRWAASPTASFDHIIV